MTRAALAAIAAGTLLSGCVAAIVPVIAGGAIGKNRIARHDRQRAAPSVSVVSAASPSTGTGGLTLLPLARMPPPSLAAATGAALPAPATDAQAGWRTLVRYVAQRMAGATDDAAPATDLDAAPCGERPEAVVLDADLATSAVATRDVAVTALNALRTMGVAVVFTADVAQAAPARAAIAQAGFGEAEEGRTLFPASAVARQAAIARDYCVIAIGGARASDFPGTAPGGGVAMGKRLVPAARRCAATRAADCGAQRCLWRCEVNGLGGWIDMERNA